jgi:hypothetical protein
MKLIGTICGCCCVVGVVGFGGMGRGFRDKPVGGNSGAAAQLRLAENISAEAAEEKWPRIDQTKYAGSKACAECHRTYYDSWKDTTHNKMIRPPKADSGLS